MPSIEWRTPDVWGELEPQYKSGDHVIVGRVNQFCCVLLEEVGRHSWSVDVPGVAGPVILLDRDIVRRASPLEALAYQAE